METLLENNLKSISINSTVFHPRLAWMIYYQQVHNIEKVCEKFKISRKTFYKWWNRYYSSGYDQSSLLDKSKRPHYSPFATSVETIQKIVDAKISTNFGIKKLRLYLIERYNIRLSEHTIWKILKRHYYTNDIKYDVKPNNHKNILPGDEVYITIYSIALNTLNFNIYIYNTIDIFSRLRVAKIYTSISDDNLYDFLKFTIQSYPFDIKKVKLIEENYYKAFNKVVNNLNIGKYSRANKFEKDMIISEIQDTDKIEYFNNRNFGSLQELSRNFDQYIIHLNNYKAHNALNGLSPIQKLKTINAYRNIVFFDHRR